MPVHVDSLPQPGGGGGGYVQTLDFDPDVANRILVGGDVWGPVLSEDGGLTWSKKALGLITHNDFNTACVFFSKFVTDTIYAGTTTGFQASADGGLSWQILSTAVTFGGNSNVPNISGNAPGFKPPRSSGHLIDEDPRDGTLIVGSFSNGVYKSSDFGATWAQIALTGAYVRNVWVDPLDPTIAWVAVMDGVVTGGSVFHGLYRIDAWQTAPVVTLTSLTPRNVNKLVFSPSDSNVMYATCHADGVYRSINHGETWTRLGAVSTALQDGLSQWSGLGARSPDVALLPLRASTADVFYDPSDPLNTDKSLEWVAPPTGETNPIVIVIHGGGGVVGDKSNMHATSFSGDIPRRFAAAGFTVVNVNYTLGKAYSDFTKDFPAGLNDLKLAVAWVKANAATIHGDATNIAIFGGSAGGTYAQLLGIGEFDRTIGDSFDAADSASINGAALSLAPGGQTWTCDNVHYQYGITSNKLAYKGSVGTFGALGTSTFPRAGFNAGSATSLLRAQITLSATRACAGFHFNSTDATQDPALSLEWTVYKSGTSSYYRLFLRAGGGGRTQLAQVTTDGAYNVATHLWTGHGPVMALGNTYDVEIDRRQWPYIQVRVKLSSSPESFWQVALAGHLQNDFGVSGANVTALAANNYVGTQCRVSDGTGVPTDDDGTTTWNDIFHFTHVYISGIKTILSASGYSDIRVGPPSTPPLQHEQTMQGWFGTDDQTGAAGWFTTVGTFDPAKPITRSFLTLMLSGCSIFDQQSAAQYAAGAIAAIIRTDSPAIHLFGSQNEVCPLFQQTAYYAALNASGRNHYDGSLAKYASVASARDTMHIFPGTNHADYPGSFDEYVNILRKDLGASPPVNDVVLVGCGSTQKITGAGYSTVWRSADGGATWTDVSSPSGTVADVVLGTTGQWWLRHSDMLGRGTATVGGCEPDPHNPGRWFTTGFGGVYRSDDDGLTWTPVANGMMSQSPLGAYADPYRSGRVYYLDNDNPNLWGSEDHGLTLVSIGGPSVFTPINGMGNPHGLVIADDTRAYLFGGQGPGGNQLGGQVISSDDPMLEVWADEGYMTAAGGAGTAAAVRGGAVIKDAGGQRVILAFTAGGGIWRGVRSASAPPGCTWTHLAVPVGCFAGANIGAYSSAANTLGLIFAFDPTSGLYRSRDYGVTWEMFWTGVSVAQAEGSALALDGTTLYVASPTGLFKIVGADQSGKTVDNAQLTATPLFANTRGVQGVVVNGNHELTVVNAATPGDGARVLRSPDAGATWVDKSDPSGFELLADARCIAFTADGWLITSASTAGMTTGQYGNFPFIPPPPPPPTADSLGFNLGQLINRVREVLRPGANRFLQPAFAAQGWTLAEMRARVRNVIRDNAVPPFISDAEINDWLNEAYYDVAWKTKLTRNSVTALTGGDGTIPVPADFTAYGELVINNVTADVVDDENEWLDWTHSGAIPPVPKVRVNGDHIDVYPVAIATSYTLRYFNRPTQLAADTDKPRLPQTVQSKLINYARGQALLKAQEWMMSDRYMSLYMDGLVTGEGVVPPDVVRAQTGPGYREVNDDEITNWLNEALLDISFRAEPLRFEATGSVTASGIPLPADYLRPILVRLSTAGVDGTFEVEFVDDSTFEFFRYDSNAAIPTHTLGRIYGGFVELYPLPPTTVTYTMRYVAQHPALVNATDFPVVPVVLQEKAIQYARGHALMAQGQGSADISRAQTYLALYERGMPQATVRERFVVGPMSLIPEQGVFDTSESRHF